MKKNNGLIKDYNQITMNEYVESTAAKKLYKNKKLITLWILFLPAIPIVAFAVIFIGILGSIKFRTLVIPVLIISAIVMLIICPIIRNKYLSKYKMIYLTAKKNDEIRYNEKVRFMEQKRLETQYNNENNNENILKTINGVGETVDD